AALRPRRSSSRATKGARCGRLEDLARLMLGRNDSGRASETGDWVHRIRWHCDGGSRAICMVVGGPSSSADSRQEDGVEVSGRGIVTRLRDARRVAGRAKMLLREEPPYSALRVGRHCYGGHVLTF